jgi:hypothetical protein
LAQNDVPAFCVTQAEDPVVFLFGHVARGNIIPGPLCGT